MPRFPGLWKTLVQFASSMSQNDRSTDATRGGVDLESFHGDAAAPAGLFEQLENRLLLSASAYHLTFNDEFNTLDLADKSGTDTGWMVRDYWYNPHLYNGELQYYSDPAVDPYNPFSINNGILTIRAEPTPAGMNTGGQPYVSGELTTTKGSPYAQDPNSLGWSQQYGYFELRAKLPAGKGLWPAFWLLPEDASWPPEYDIFEVLGDRPDEIHQTAHWGSEPNHPYDSFNYVGGIDSSDGFHVYGFEWDADHIRWYVDGQLTEVQQNRVNEPMYMLIQLAVGGWAGTPNASTTWPADMQVDYVRVYSKDPSIPEITPQAGYSPSAYIPDGTAGMPVELAATHDAYVRDGADAGKNFGTSNGLIVKKGNTNSNRESYLKFDVSSIDAVDSAQLLVYLANSTNPATANISIYGAADTSWTEGNIRWNNKPATDLTPIVTASVTTDDSANWQLWDVSDYIQQQVAAGHDEVTLVIRSEDVTGPLFTFRSEENSGASQDPFLRVVPKLTTGTQTTLSATHDAYVRDGTYAGDNFGGDTALVVKSAGADFNRESYLQFDLSGVSTVDSGILRLHLNTGATAATAPISVYGAPVSTWNETNLRWNNKPATSGGAIATTSVTVGAAAAWYEWDVTSYLQQEKAAGRDLVTLVLKTNTSTQPVFRFSSEETTGSDLDPQLVITHNSGAIGEVGVVNVTTDDANDWLTVNLDNTYVDPVVVAGPASANGSDPTTVRVRNVTANSFQVQIDDWDYLSPAHTEETVSYLVIESGRYVLEDGRVLEAGNAVGVDHNFTTVSFDTAFAAAPVVLSQVVTTNGGAAVVTRQQSVGAGSFQLRVQEEQAADGTHAAETLGWVAIEAGSGTLGGQDFQAGTTGDNVTDSVRTINFAQSFAAAPAFFANIRTYDGADPAGLRYQNLGAGSVQIFVEEEQSADTEVAHTDENVGFLAIGVGDLLGQPAGPLYSENFDDGVADGITNRSGTWAINASNRYEGQNTAGPGNRAISTIDASAALPNAFSFSLTTRTKDVGAYENAMIIFDYVDDQNFKYANVADGADKWYIGEAVGGVRTNLVELSETINTNVDYSMTLEVVGSVATLKVDGVVKLSYTFSGAINDGLLGFGVENALAVFDDLLIEVL